MSQQQLSACMPYVTPYVMQYSQHRLDVALKCMQTTADFTANDVYELVKITHQQTLELLQTLVDMSSLSDDTLQTDSLSL